MTIHFEEKGQDLFVFLSGEIDHYVAGKISQSIDKRFLNEDYKRLVLDFTNVTFMDSSGIGMVTGRIKRMEAKGGTVSMDNCNPYVKRILQMAGIFTLASYGGGNHEQ